MESNDHVKTHRRAEGNAVIVSGAARLAGRRSGILLGCEKEILSLGWLTRIQDLVQLLILKRNKRTSKIDPCLDRSTILRESQRENDPGRGSEG
jgi:hypothetical protein